jgi:threonine synthase
MFVGCLACSEDGIGQAIEVDYTDRVAAVRSPGDVLRVLSVARQPITAQARVELGRPPSTPLAALAAFGDNLFAKNETLNPTWGHKDRLHEVGVGAALLLGCLGVVAASTGNHGAAAAAHASAAGLPSVIFCHPDASASALKMITAYGGQPVYLPDEAVHGAVAELVDAGWFPATSMDPLVSGRSNPFGAEGYKIVAYEVVAQLGGCPGTVIVPTASGDTYYGIAKGFAEAAELLDQPMPNVIAAQPTGADPLVRSSKVGRLVRVPNPHSLALSIAEAVTGRQALSAISRWRGGAVAVSDEDIVVAVRDLARRGLLVEPASAASLAAYRELRAAGLSSERPTVLLLTGAGVKWPAAMSTIFPGGPLSGVAELDTYLAGIGVPAAPGRSTGPSAR